MADQQGRDLTPGTPAETSVLVFWDASPSTDDAESIAVSALRTVVVTQNSVTQHQAALSITESQISDLGAYITVAGVTYEALDANGDVGTGVGQLAIGNHTHAGVYEPVDATLLRQADVDDTPVDAATTVPISSNWAFDHDVADEHVAHSGVTLTAGAGLTGGGDITVGRSFSLADMAQATIKGRADAAGTGVPVDLTAAQVRTIINVEDGATADQTAGEIEAIVNHDNLLGFVANEHIDWTADQGATNLHANNVPDLSATYATAEQGATADTALQPGAIGVIVQAWDADLDTWATKTAPTGVVVGTTDAQVLSDKEIRDYSETAQTPTISAGAVTVDFEAGNVAVVTLTENITTLTISNPPASGKIGAMTVWLVQDATGGRTVTWPGSVSWGDQSAPTIASAATEETIVTLITRNAGTSYKGILGWKTA